MKTKDIIKNIIMLLSPILLFFVLALPYQLINQLCIVKWLGCGCPNIDADGNAVYAAFNANDFTRIFWLFIALVSTVLSIFVAKKVIKSKIWLRIIYVAMILVISVLLADRLTMSMMWN